jgi:hypothetical protein
MKYLRTPRVRPNRLMIWQGGSASGEGQLRQWTERENQALVAAGFESADEEDGLWSKDAVWFGRKAALQNCRANAVPEHR